MAPSGQKTSTRTPSAQKAFIETETGAKLACLFNPSELSISKSNTWQADTVPGKEAPEVFFGGGGAGSMRLELMFDTTAEGKPVTRYTNKLLDLMKVDTSLPGYDDSINNGRPPWVKFHWGDLHGFKAVIESVDLTFTYFSKSGMPLRAKVSLALKQYEPDANWGPQNPTSGTPRPQRTHQVRSGETLDRIAAMHYGDSNRWRDIAQANGVTDPFDLPPGRMLSIPKLRG
ncbi:MAG: LysM peptidoglycan-binding domain-containing protein [Acidimicrobiia bacterium]|nr:LysM peptidoglycan-binding domain-containing protein [Acidimicrobiia bacterium]